MPTLIRISTAAEILRKSSRSIWRLIKRGHIRGELVNGERRVVAEDVLQVKQGIEKPPAVPFNRVTMGRLAAELRLMKVDVKRCVDLLNLELQPLELPAAELVDRFQAAEQMAAAGYQPEPARPWVEFLLRIRREDLKTVEKATADAHPWRGPFNLAGTLRVGPQEAEQDPSLPGMLSAAQRHIEALTYSWIVQKCGVRLLRRHVRRLADRKVPGESDAVPAGDGP